MSDLALSVVLGVALAAATGFRVFLPMLIASGGAYTDGRGRELRHLHCGTWRRSPDTLLGACGPVAAIGLVVLFLLVALRLIRRRFGGDESSTGLTSWFKSNA
jgi:hypothetical protein